MRPRSIIIFERIYLASLLLAGILLGVGYVIAREVLDRMPAGAEVPPAMSGTFGGVLIVIMVATFLITIGVPLLLWWLAARKRIEVAKWLLLAVSVLSISYWIYNLAFLLTTAIPDQAAEVIGEAAALQPLLLAADGVSELLGIIALVFLFRRDATEWFRTASPNVNAELFR